MKATICDFKDCPEYAAYEFNIIDGDEEGFSADACSLDHVTGIVASLHGEDDEEEPEQNPNGYAEVSASPFTPDPMFRLLQARAVVGQPYTARIDAAIVKELGLPREE